MTRRSALLISAGLLALTALMLLTLFGRLSSHSNSVNGPTSPAVPFKVGQAKRLAPPIRRDGPLLFQDPLSKGRDIYLQHLGDDPSAGWIAVAARTGPSCRVQWSQRDQVFRSCDGRHFSDDGSGLRPYSVHVIDGTVEVSL